MSGIAYALRFSGKSGHVSVLYHHCFFVETAICSFSVNDVVAVWLLKLLSSLMSKED